MPTFFSPNALESMRASGYQNTQYALAELVDNSFDANADTVKIVFFERKRHNKRYIDEILVADNGDGMDANQLQVCLQFGYTANTNLDEIVSRRIKGKFGFGLPNASLSQSPNINVFSRQDAGLYLTTCLDLEQVKQTGTIDIPPVSPAELPAHYQEIELFSKTGPGTIVSWRDCDRLSNTRADTIIEKSERLLGQIYRYLITSGKKIVLEAWEHNPERNKFNLKSKVFVAPNDPLFLMKDTFIARLLFQAANDNTGIQDPQKDPATFYKKFAKTKEECEPTNVPLDDHCYDFEFEWQGKRYKFAIKTSIALLDIQKPGIREGARTKVGQFYGSKRHISFVRADREICEGNFGFYKETEPRNRWWSIEVQFTGDADDLLGVSNNKQGIGFVYTAHPDATEQWDPHTATLLQAREHLWVQLTNKIEAARLAAWKLVSKQHKEWELQHTEAPDGGRTDPLPGATDITVQATRKTDGPRESKFLPQQRVDLLARLQEKYPSVVESEIERAIDDFDESRVKGCILYSPSEANALWSITSVHGFLIILINVEHEFYKRVIHPFRHQNFKAPLSAIELFISSLAWEEFSHFNSNESHRNTLELFRNYMGLHLNRYLLENDVIVYETDLETLELSTADEAI